MALGVDGVKVGVWTSPDAPTGVTVILPPEGSLGAVAVRGAAPGTREAIALGPTGKITVCHGVVLSGGSAFGLATADGVVRWLEEHDIGYRIPIAVVPIVGAAIVLDQGVAFREHRPGPDAGYAACEAATEDDPEEGSVGAGTGCTVAKVGGLEHAWRGGQGVAVHRSGDVVVGAVVINNAVGEVVAEDGTRLAPTRAPESQGRYPYEGWPVGAGADEPSLPGGGPTGGADDHGTGGRPTDGTGENDGSRAEDAATGPAQNTVVGCVVTNARLTKPEAVRVADLAHSGVARSLRPAHTSMDGDALFCLSTQQVEAHIDLVAALAADVVAEACRRGPLAAVTRDGIPGLASRS